MKVYQILPIAMISMGLIACGGGSGSNNDSTPATPIPVAQATNNTADQAKAKAEAEAKAKAEAEAKKKAEEAAKAKAEAEAKANQEQLNKLKEQALVKGLSQAEADKYAENSLNKIDAIAQANLDKAIADKALKDRAITVPTINGVKVQRNIRAYESSATESGKAVTTVGRHENKPVINLGTQIRSGTKIVSSNGYITDAINVNGFGTVDGKKIAQSIQGTERIYFQPYSVVYGTTYDKVVVDGKTIVDKPQAQIEQVAGYAVTDKSLPTVGTATYTGKAFVSHDFLDDNGSRDTYSRNELDYNATELLMNFNYTVDFGSKTGSGLIYDSGWGGTYNSREKLILEQGVLEKLNIDGVTTYGVKSNVNRTDAFVPIEMKGSYYELGLFGPNAEEVAGRVVLNNYNTHSPNIQYYLRTGELVRNKNGGLEFGFAGTRGEIQK